MSQKNIKNRIKISNIQVENIDTVSGIFVGTNYSHNWSSHRKNNYGFGTISNSSIHRNVSYVIDNDFVDTPINQNTISLTERGNNINNNQVEVVEININVLDTNSALSLGENDLNGWSSHSKRNAGQGRFIGNLQNTQNASSIFDQDIIDAPISHFNKT